MSWLRRVTERPDAGPTLVCFPHAGGSASFFRPWEHLLPEWAIHAVQYPGRADRINEPVPTDLPTMAREMLDEVAGLRDRPVVFFGHSMGAVVAFEVARLLAARDIPVAHLFVSGCRAADDPGLAPQGAAQRDDETILRGMARLGGTHPELLDDPMLRELVMSYVRADFVMFEEYAYRPGPILACPVTAVNGDADSHIPPERARGWARLTSGPFDQHVLPGEHFYLLDHPPTGLIRQRLPGAATSGRH